MNVGAPFSIANRSSIQFVRTLISRPYTRYLSVNDGRLALDTRHRFFAVFSIGSGLPSAPSAWIPSTFRAYSRTRYDPGVQTAMNRSVCGWRADGTTASTST